MTKLYINEIDCGDLQDKIPLTKFLPEKQNLPNILGCQSHIRIGDDACSSYKVADGTSKCGLLDTQFVNTPVLDTTGTSISFELSNMPSNSTATTIPTGWNQTKNYMGLVIDNLLGQKIYTKLDINDILNDSHISNNITIKIPHTTITPKSILVFATNSFEITDMPSMYGLSATGTTYQVNNTTDEERNMNDNRYNLATFTHSTSADNAFVPYKDNTIKKSLLLTDNRRVYIDVRPSTTDTPTRYQLGLIWFATNSIDKTSYALNVIPWKSPIYSEAYKTLLPFAQINPTFKYELNAFDTTSTDTTTGANAKSLFEAQSTEIVSGTSISSLPPSNITITTSQFKGGDITSTNPLVVSYICVLSNDQVITPYTEDILVKTLTSTTTSTTIDWLDITNVSGLPITSGTPKSDYTNTDISKIYTLQITSVMVYFKFGKAPGKWEWRVFERTLSPNTSNYTTYMSGKDYTLQFFNNKASGSNIAGRWILSLKRAVKQGTSTDYEFDDNFSSVGSSNEKLVVSNFTMSSLTPVTSIWNGFDTKEVGTVVDWENGSVKSYGTTMGIVSDDLSKLIIRSTVNTQKIYG